MFVELVLSKKTLAYLASLIKLVLFENLSLAAHGPSNRFLFYFQSKIQALVLKLPEHIIFD